MAALTIRGLLLIALAVALTFANALHDRFHFDDDHSLVTNSHIRQWAEIPNFFSDPQLFSRNQGSEMYRPLVLFSYAITYRFYGYQAPVYHLFNIGVHLLVVFAVYGLYLRLGLRGVTALGGAILFGIHPLVGEPVNYVSSRSESLAALFFLAGLLCYTSDRGWALALALACYMGALMSKSSAIVLPAVLLAYEGLMRGPSLRWRRLVPFGVLALGYLWASRRLLQEAVVTAPVRDWTQQFSTQAKALAYYAKLLLFPHPLSVEHQFATADSLSDPSVAWSLALVGTLAYILWCGRRWRPVVFWLAWIAIVLAPTLVVPLNVLVNERRLYLALVAAIGAGAWIWQRGAGDQLRRYAVLVLGLVLMGLTSQRNEVWRDEKSLWEDARRQAPQMVRPHVRLGAVYRSEGDLKAAASAYARALALDPNHAPAHNNLGNLHRDTGDLKAAERAYRRALELLLGYPDAMVNLATLLSDQGRFAAALSLYQRALEQGGERVEIYNNMGTAYLKVGQYQQAEIMLRRGLALGDEKPGIYFNLGGALEGQGKVPEAAAAYGRAVWIDSTYARAYYNLGLLYEGEGAHQAASKSYRAFIRHWRGDPRFSLQAEERLRVLAGKAR